MVDVFTLQFRTRRLPRFLVRCVWTGCNDVPLGSAQREQPFNWCEDGGQHVACSGPHRSSIGFYLGVVLIHAQCTSQTRVIAQSTRLGPCCYTSPPLHISSPYHGRLPI